MAQSQTPIADSIQLIHNADGWHYQAVEENTEAGSVLMRCTKCGDLMVVTHMDAETEPEPSTLPEPQPEPGFESEIAPESVNPTPLSDQTQQPQELRPQESPSDSAPVEKGKRRRSS